MNDTTSTIAAAQANSHSGIGRSARDAIPCAIRIKTGSTRSFARPASSPASSNVWLSSSNSPSRFALKLNRAGLPGAASFSRS